MVLYAQHSYTLTAPSSKPGELRVHHRTPTSAQLSWTPIPKDQQNGIITGYSVQVAGPDFTREVSITDATATSTEISNLRPSTSYYFSISARTMAGTGPAARSLSITLQGSKAYQLLVYLYFSEASLVNALLSVYTYSSTRS